ncbi:MAG: hypothetical protein JSW00_05280 [Thermoplasmata archaeon]|nr:MAG: hypothetical protein JSW00_05280 [Thermoplasmata archaeon]
MRKYIAILGTLLIATILLSGSAIATWYYAGNVYIEGDCENSEYALGEPNFQYATVGTNDPDPAIGDLWLDFGFGGIPKGQLVWVYGWYGGGILEYYRVDVYANDGETSCSGGSYISDQINHSFYTGSYLPTGLYWKFVRIQGETGSTGPSDTIYGPEIDAVGFEIP